MKIVMPSTEFRTTGVRLAPRPASLRGATVGFLDGWGRHADDGSIAMYPLMEALWRLLAERYGVAQFVWQKKPNISKRAPKEQMTLLADRAAVVINGEAA